MKQNCKTSQKSITKKKLQNIGVSQYTMYRQLTRQIGITSPIQKNLLKFNLKQKLNKHIEFLQSHRYQDKNIEARKFKQNQKRQQRLKKLKSSIQKKQSNAKQRKQKHLNKKKQRTQTDILKWQKIVLKNKQNDKINVKKSMKQISIWNQKCQNSQRKKTQVLSNISQKSFQHNQHVRKISDSNRHINQSYSCQNPQSFLNNIKIPKQLSPSSRKKMSRIFRTQATHKKILQNKKELQVKDFQRSVELNINKQRRIIEARQLKKYIYGRKNKLITQKSEITKNKIKQNYKKLSQLDLLRKKQIQKKLNQNRNATRNTSLPIMTKNALIKQYKINRPSNDADDSSIYVTMPNEDNTQRYNKVIMDKLRSISLIIKKNSKDKSKSMFK